MAKSTGEPGRLGSTPVHTVCSTPLRSTRSTWDTNPLPLVSRMTTWLANTGVAKPADTNSVEGGPCGFNADHAVGVSPSAKVFGAPSTCAADHEVLENWLLKPKIVLAYSRTAPPVSPTISGPSLVPVLATLTVRATLPPLPSSTLKLKFSSMIWPAA